MFEKILNDANLKWDKLTSPENIWIRVSYGASGQAAGADYVYDKLNKLSKNNNNVFVDYVGSMGLSYAEPLVDFTFGNGIRIFYNNVDSKNAEIIYNSLIKSLDLLGITDTSQPYSLLCSEHPISVNLSTISISDKFLFSN